MKMKKIISLALVAALVLGLCACGKKNETGNTDAPAANEQENQEDGVPESELSYSELSTKIYNEALGEFYQTYQAAFNATTISERYALMALAEGKLMESAAMLPTATKGGRYQMVRSAYRTADYQLWGNDEERFEKIIVAKEIIKKEDVEALKSMWAELRGTGTYNAEAKKYLESHGYTIDDAYATTFSSNPVTWDVLATSRQADSQAIVKTYDGLMAYDCEGVLQPALAESYEVSDDGLTYTFHIRQGAQWVDSQGRKVGDVTADDFVAGMNHMMDAQGGLEYLIQGVIVNADEYINGEVTDFAEVGVKATDDYTLVYTLTKPCTYFTTMLGYGVFAPMNRAYYVSQGGKFGAEYDSSATDYVYGTDPDHIAYCGAFLVTNCTADNIIAYEANPTYWNYDNMNIHKFTYLYNDGQDPTKAFEDFKAGLLSGCAANASILEIVKAEGYFEPYCYVSDTDATSYMMFFNMNRKAFANVNDSTKVVSPQTEEQAARTNKAMRNAHFRRALAFSMDRIPYNAQGVGEECAAFSVRNSYTPGTFVSLEEDTTVSINGQSVTFPAGTYFGEIAQAQIDADGVKLKIWDGEADGGIGSSDGFDGWYNPANAVEELNAAVAELGFEITAENPIYIDYPYVNSVEIYTNKANTIKQSVEAATNGAIIVNLVDCADYNEWYYAGYQTDTGDEANYDMYDCSGWGPDYGDPSTYLDTMLPDFAGYMVKCFGIF